MPAHGVCAGDLGMESVATLSHPSQGLCYRLPNLPKRQAISLPFIMGRQLPTEALGLAQGHGAWGSWDHS